jgi:hypothetical protein
MLRTTAVLLAAVAAAGGPPASAQTPPADEPLATTTTVETTPAPAPPVTTPTPPPTTEPAPPPPVTTPAPPAPAPVAPTPAPRSDETPPHLDPVRPVLTDPQLDRKDKPPQHHAKRPGRKRCGQHWEPLPKPKNAPRVKPHCEVKREGSPQRKSHPRPETPDVAPTAPLPGFVDALPGPSSAAGVPNFIIRKFRVPPFLLPIYQAAGIQYGIRWEVLAAINEIESDYGRNLNVSSAGALGWMQFMPSTWELYGADANKDGRKDPYNPVDAIFAAARYLKAADYEHDVRRAIFAYNHADWYVDSVLLRARLIAGVPADLIGSLTGLTEGRFPVYARARYADDLAEKGLLKRVKAGQNAANLVESAAGRRGIDIFAREGSPVVAVNDGVIKKIGQSKRLGRYLILQDVYGNRYTYGNLGKVSHYYPVPKTDTDDRHVQVLKANEPADPKPTTPASAGHQLSKRRQPAPSSEDRRSQASAPIKQRLFAHPDMPQANASGGLEQLLDSRTGGKGSTYRNYFSRPFGLDPSKVRLRTLKQGSHVIGGTILGRVASHVEFEIRPAGKGAPRIDPKPILDGWKLLEATAIYRASGRNVLHGDEAGGMSIGQILLLPKPLLEKRVLADERIEIYAGGRDDIRSGQIDRRVLATLEYLAESGLRPTITSLESGHGYYTSSGNVSEHSSGNAVDIAQVNGIPIVGHQETGGIADQSVRRLMLLQGTLRPHQIISLLDYGQNTLAMADHDDHIHIGFQPLFGANTKLARQAMTVLKPGQWSDLLDRLGEIDNPVVPTKPSKYAIPVKKHRASNAHNGE